MAPRGVGRRSPLVLAGLAAAVFAMMLTAVPAHGQTLVTTTSTYTLWNGDTVTVVTTYVNGVLSSVSSTEVTPTGLVVDVANITYYPNGQVNRFVDIRTLMGGAYQTTLIRQYSSTGVVMDQYVRIVSNGQTTAEQLTTYDASGFPLTSETRILTLANGTRIWVVTTQTWSSGVLVSSTTAQYPLGYNFGSLPVWAQVDPRPTWPGNGPKGSGAPGQDPNGWRPGNGGGDPNHQHYGAPGQNKKAP